MPSPIIHLVFKTHLDIGFTQLAERVRRQYHDIFIPGAIDTGEHLLREDPRQRLFVWTTGAWLIRDHLETQSPERVRRLERAIEHGLIRWHALPFTTHTELMSPSLFRAGLFYAQELDRRFGVKTIAAKMTDVPGHTLGIVPLLARAGVKFLHIGVNSASTPPDVPDLFRWRAPGGEEILVAYQKNYGSTHFVEGANVALSFAHTNDNLGPQNVGQTIDCHRDLRDEYPDAEIRASTLDAFAEAIWPLRERFPLLEREIGDSWIHGVGTDPAKLSRFLELQRLYDRFDEEGLTPSRAAFGRRLCLVPEHTWGVDIKTYLRDETHWDRADFERARRDDPRFAFCESSWSEQSAYLDAAVEALDGEDRTVALAPLADATPRILDASGHAPADPPAQIEFDGWRVALDRASGAPTALVAPNGARIAGDPLIAYTHESYDANDVATHMRTYLTDRVRWALLDHGKPGLENARTAQSARFATQFAGVESHADRVLLHWRMPERAHAQLGAPACVLLSLRAVDATRLRIELVLRDKPANRMPEAGFLAFAPAGASDWELHKLGLWLRATDIVRNGGGALQAASCVRAKLDAGVALRIEPLDAPLVAPADAPFMTFAGAAPDFSAGIRFNLHNNKWGTNFPMWCEGTLRFRFDLEIA
ncbi:MAG: DUF5054 domain-containing protein [Rudaea sp.]|uniref:DUF5054 domain-containing protein n=1 Tax=Rudaea sp. TaxID=2136325 RepID=UPI0039E51BD2